MQIRLLLFAHAADAAGTRHATLALSPPATAADALTAALDRFPDLGPHAPTLAIAVNHQLVGPHHILSDGDTIALLPPVSGG